MKKPKRQELIKTIIRKTGIPESSKPDYLNRIQLVELISLIELYKTRIETLINLLKWAESETKNEKMKFEINNVIG